MSGINYSALETWNVWVNIEEKWYEKDGQKTTYRMEIFSFNTYKEAVGFKLFMEKKLNFNCGYFYEFYHRNVEETKMYCEEVKYLSASGEEKILWNTLQK